MLPAFNNIMKEYSTKKEFFLEILSYLAFGFHTYNGYMNVVVQF